MNISLASQLREHKCYFFASSGDDINDNITGNFFFHILKNTNIYNGS